MRAALLAALALVAALALGVAVGPGGLTPGQLAAILLSPDAGAPLSRAIVWDLRVPRLLVAALVGGALGAAGTVTQGLFRNPMAGPGVLGLASGAALAAALGLVLGLDTQALWAVPVLAGVGAASAMALLLALAGRAAGMTTLLLAGVALGAAFSAATTLLLALHTEHWDLARKVVRWLMGSLEGRGWSHLSWGLPPVTAGLALALWLRRDLDALILGPEAAASLGVEPGPLRLRATAAVGLLVGAATALTGVIGFLGLVIPHLVRLAVGAGHRRLLPLATIWGAVALVLVDTLGRAASHTVLPPGALTSLLGAPFFLWLLRRRAGGLP